MVDEAPAEPAPAPPQQSVPDPVAAPVDYDPAVDDGQPLGPALPFIDLDAPMPARDPDTVGARRAAWAPDLPIKTVVVGAEPGPDGP